MSYTLRQVQPLLNATELLLFSQSRRDRIGALTPRELRAKVTRSRTLRDKFRDLYKRQTVAAQRNTRTPRQLTGAENERTQKKAEIFAELLERFETQLAKVEAKAASKPATTRAAAQPAAKSTTRTTPKKAVKPAEKTVKKTAAASKKAATSPAKRASTTKATTSSKRTTSAATQTATARSMASSSRPARATRVNTLKEAPINKKVHASARARNARQQARKDSR